MALSASEASLLRFGVIELNLKTRELRKAGVLLHLPPQPFKILALLASRPGQLVMREEIQRQVWGSETFVDFELGLNAAMKSIRHVLGDDPETPRYIQTLPRRGYRFIAPVDVAPPSLAASVAQIDSIAVLPLENFSGDKDQEYFADGMTEALITDLGKIRALRVISRTSVMQYKGAQKSLAQIARELNVDAIVEGAVLRSGDRVRISAQLIQANPEKHLWADSYERDLRDVLALQGEVARAIANEVRIKITPQEQARLAHARQVNPQAHELYLKGQYYNNRRDPDKASEYFKAAIDADPTYAPPHAGLAAAYSYLGRWEVLPASEAFSKARAAAQKALELDETLGEAHAALGFTLLSFDWDWTAAEREYKRALELSPNVAPIRSSFGQFLARMGRHQEAIGEARRGVELDPVSPERSVDLGWIYWESRQYDQALEQYRKTLELDPTQNVSFYFAVAFREKGMYQEAIAEFLQMPDNPVKFGHGGNAYARAGRVREAREAIRKLKERARTDFRGTCMVAIIYAGLGEKDQAFEWLEKAYLVRDRGMTFLKIDPALDALRSDPRFQDLLRRMNFPQ